MMLPATGRCRDNLHRAIWLQLLFGLMVLSIFCDACTRVTFIVPPTLEAGVLVGRVNVKWCLKHSGFISSSNPNFTILEDGSLYTTNAISLPSHENTTFLIFLKSIREHELKKIYVSLLTHPKQTAGPKARRLREAVVKRTKRKWAPVPTTIMENSLGPFPMQIQQLSSDMAQKYSIRYSISGPGVDKPPVNYFYIEQDTGNLFVTCPIDREVYPEFQIICYAVTPDGYTPEIPLVHVIKIEDDNDNPPLFDNDMYTFCVLENSRTGTLVGHVSATDRDEPYTLHTRVKYRIVSQSTSQMYHRSGIFAIDPDSGAITVAASLLDRETVPVYNLIIEARDMGGQEFGLCTSATVTVEIADANDNAPQFIQSVYEVQIPENTANIEILRIPIKDDDEPGAPSWLATLTIIKGNEDESFFVTVDRDTNVGILTVLKGLDYESTKERRLEIAVNNEAPYDLAPNSRPISTSTVIVIVRITDEDEGPVFEPFEYILNIKEGLPGGTIVGYFQARDPETGNSDGISYQIINDPCNWITVDNLGQLRTTRILDRDAPNMEFSQCNITVCATDRNGKTGIGKIVINLMDENDNFPVVLKRNYTMCNDKKPICIAAFDADTSPYSMPYHFEIEEPVNSMWQITPNNDESALLSPVGDIQYGYYSIPLRIYDNAGNSGISEISIHYCNCTIPSNCTEPSLITPVERVPVGNVPYQAVPTDPLGIGATVMGSLFLLSSMTSLGCCWYCKKKGKGQEQLGHDDDVAFQNLIVSNTEAPGEQLTEPSIQPVKTIAATTSMATSGEKIGRQENLEMIKGGRHTPDSVKGGGTLKMESVRNLAQPLKNSYGSLCSEWQSFTHSHLTEKVFLCGQDEECKQFEEYVLSYKYEGKGSPVGSLSSCTGQTEEEEKLDFLYEPEPAFKTFVDTWIKE